MKIKERDLAIAKELAQSGDLSHIFCIFGSANPHVAHYGVKYICVKYGKAEFCCVDHGHPGAPCCVKVTERKAKNMAKKKNGGSGNTINTICPNSNSRHVCPLPRYYCSKDKLYYCFDHTHPYVQSCCRYSDQVQNIVFNSESEFGSAFDGSGEFSTSTSDDVPACEKKGCDYGATWFCKRDKKKRCASHAHQGNCCEYIDTASKCGKKSCYTKAEFWCDNSRDLFCKKHKHKGKCCTEDKQWDDLGEGEEEAEKEKPLKVVKFANS